MILKPAKPRKKPASLTVRRLPTIRDIDRRLNRLSAEFEALKRLGAFGYRDLYADPSKGTTWHPHPYTFEPGTDRDGCYTCSGGILHPIHATENQVKAGPKK